LVACDVRIHDPGPSVNKANQFHIIISSSPHWRHDFVRPMVPEKITFIPVEIGSSVLWLTGRDAFFFPLGYHYAQVFPPYGECYVINDMATLSLEIIIMHLK